MREGGGEREEELEERKEGRGRRSEELLQCSTMDGRVLLHKVNLRLVLC